MTNVEHLSAEACLALLRAGLVGRVAFWADGPHVVPVNFAVTGTDLGRVSLSSAVASGVMRDAWQGGRGRRGGATTTEDNEDQAPAGRRAAGHGTRRHALVLRTSAESLLAARGPGTQVALEIDHIDYEGHRGWSVVAVGPCTTIEDAAVIEAICGDWEPRPWADGDCEAFLAIAPETVSGRRVGGGWTYANEVPVRRHR